MHAQLSYFGGPRSPELQKIVMNIELLPGEDAAQLPGPDRIEILPVVEVHEVSRGGSR